MCRVTLDAGACPAGEHPCPCATGSFCVPANVACVSPTSQCPTVAVDAGAPCPPVGSSCSVQGRTCGTPDPNVHCGAIEECSTVNPAVLCPISSSKFKDDIEYLGGAGLQELHDETLAIHLATYNYKAQYDDPNPRHLGFIIEDNPRSPAVDWSHDRVDIYGYLSMVVATMQVQEKEIAELRRELDLAHQGICSSEPRSSQPR